MVVTATASRPDQIDYCCVSATGNRLLVKSMKSITAPTHLVIHWVTVDGPSSRRQKLGVVQLVPLREHRTAPRNSKKTSK